MSDKNDKNVKCSGVSTEKIGKNQTHIRVQPKNNNY